MLNLEESRDVLGQKRLVLGEAHDAAKCRRLPSRAMCRRPRLSAWPVPQRSRDYSRKSRSFFERLGLSQLSERLGLDLPNALAGDSEVATHLFQGPTASVLKAEPQLQHSGLALAQRVEHIVDLLLEQLVRSSLRGGESAPVFDKVAQGGCLPSSPIGVSRETGSWDILRISRTFSGVISMPEPISSLLGSRPYSWTRRRLTRRSLLIVSTMCTGMRMVRAWSAIALVIACRIHHVA